MGYMDSIEKQAVRSVVVAADEVKALKEHETNKGEVGYTVTKQIASVSFSFFSGS